MHWLLLLHRLPLFPWHVCDVIELPPVQPLGNELVIVLVCFPFEQVFQAE
jgi:hypothetical protein